MNIGVKVFLDQEVTKTMTPIPTETTIFVFSRFCHVNSTENDNHLNLNFSKLYHTSI